MDDQQKAVCAKYGADFTPPDDAYMVGISESALRGELPLFGLRHPPENGTTGWYIWGGEQSDAVDFFMALHAHHLIEDCPAALPFLALPPGWGFIVAPDYEDVWFDSSLLDI